MSQIEKEINLLIEKINKWNKEYFDNNSPTVSDRVYDTNLRKLFNLEKQHPKFLNKNSPTNNMGSNLIDKFKKILHNEKMLSLNKAYSKEDLAKFINDVLKITKNENEKFYIEPKIDGLSISLHYENRKLIKAVTRGDGNIGEDVTDNVFEVIKDIPTLIKYKKNIEIRGEIFITKSNFNKINDKEQKFSNPRNMASGTLRQISKKIVIERKLSCFAYEIISPQLHKINTFNETILLLKKNGFKIIEQNKISDNIENIIEYVNNFENNRKELDFETDGLVIKLNDILQYDKLGFTSKFPKYSIAYKFNDELVETKLNGIHITIGRTGMVTYNAELEPILLKGTIVSAATLHNFNYINKLNINIGDNVMIKKAGEIIPKVFLLSKKNNKLKFEKIMICPFCNKSLIDNKLNTDQFCTNELCSEINIKKIMHFVSRKGMNISGLGESWIRIFYNLQIIEKYPDIYFLKDKIAEIKKIDRVGERFLNNLFSSIENSKKNNLPTILFALGIDNIGEKNCRLIASEIHSLSDYVEFDFKKLCNIKDLGPITLNSLVDFHKKKQNINNIKTLIQVGINPIYKKQIINSVNFFFEKIFVITGKLNINRSDLKSIIENNGGKVSSVISSKTNYLICGNNYGSKKVKAEDLGIKIISEKVLMEFIKQI